MNKQIDFTDCRRIAGKAYNGANGKKIAVEYNGKQYMLKFPPSGKERPAFLGVPAQETMLGTFTVGGNVKVVCACLDFTSNDKQLFDFCSIKNTVLDSDSNGSGTELEDKEVLYARVFQFPTSAIKLNGQKTN